MAEALAKNGRLVAGFLVGVLPGIHPTEGQAEAAAARGALGGGGARGGPEQALSGMKQTAWFAPVQPQLDPSSLVRAPLGGAGSGAGGGAGALVAAGGLGGLLLRLTEYLFGW